MEKRKVLAIGKSSAHRDDKWLIGQIVEVEEDVGKSTQKGGFVGAYFTATLPWSKEEFELYSCAIKLSKKRY